jgi:hypothetical protein
LATGKAIRADDGAGLNIATVTFSEDAVTKHVQQTTLVDSATPSQKLSIDASGNVAVKAAANSGIDIGDVTINNAAGASAVNVQDGGNSLTVDGTVAVSTTSFGVKPLTSGGLSIYHVVSAATDNAANVKASAGQLFGWSIYNNAGYPVYVKFHNTAGTPTSGSGVVKALGVQAGTRAEAFTDVGIAFGTGIGISIVKGITDASTTAVALSDCIVDVFYA